MADETTQLVLGDAAVDATTEGRRGRRRKRENDRVLTQCENCGAQLAGEYCSRCGQHAIDYRRSLWRVLIDAADSFLNWDTKFLSTIGVLLAKPWKLTNDFNAGRRARYVHPLRLYLLASVSFFLMTRMLHIDEHITLRPQDRAEISSALATLTAPGSALPPDQQAKIDSIRARITQANGAISAEERADLKNIINDAINAKMKDKLQRADRARLKAAIAMIPKAPKPPAAPEPPQQPEAAAQPVPAISPAAPPQIQFNFGTDEKTRTPFESWLQNKVKEKVGPGGANAKLFAETLRNNIPTMMLCCIPLFAVVLKALYVRRRRYYVEHLVYALHIHSFVYLAAVVITLIAFGLGQWSNTARALVMTLLYIAVAVQVFRSILRVYDQGWLKSSVKFVVGGFVYFVILVLAVTVTAVVTILLP
jgi:hypothetical protein